MTRTSGDACNGKEWAQLIMATVDEGTLFFATRSEPLAQVTLYLNKTLFGRLVWRALANHSMAGSYGKQRPARKLKTEKQ